MGPGMFDDAYKSCLLMLGMIVAAAVAIGFFLGRI